MRHKGGGRDWQEDRRIVVDGEREGATRLTNVTGTDMNDRRALRRDT
jgi:hypothetical protein